MGQAALSNEKQPALFFVSIQKPLPKAAAPPHKAAAPPQPSPRGGSSFLLCLRLLAGSLFPRGQGLAVVSHPSAMYGLAHGGCDLSREGHVWLGHGGWSLAPEGHVWLVHSGRCAPSATLKELRFPSPGLRCVAPLPWVKSKKRIATL